jgi:uncharacterized membrane protein
VVFWTAVALVALPVLLAAGALAAAAMNHAVSRIYLGETTTIRAAYKTVWQRGWRYIGLYLLEGLLIGGIPVVIWTVLIFLAAAGAALAGKMGMGNAEGGFLVGLTVIILLVAVAGYVIWIALKLSLAFPACVVEQMGAWSAIKRSFSLSDGSKGRIFLLGLLVLVLSWLISMCVTIPLTIILELIPGVNSPQHAQTAGMAMIFILYGASFAVQTLIRPVYGIALVLFYYDQRIRKEGFDIEWMMLQAGMTPVQPQAPEAAPWLPVVARQQESAIAGADFAANIEPPTGGDISATEPITDPAQPKMEQEP